jgi:hypothetical protein
MARAYEQPSEQAADRTGTNEKRFHGPRPTRHERDADRPD